MKTNGLAVFIEVEAGAKDNKAKLFQHRRCGCWIQKDLHVKKGKKKKRNVYLLLTFLKNNAESYLKEVGLQDVISITPDSEHINEVFPYET